MPTLTHWAWDSHIFFASHALTLGYQFLTHSQNLDLASIPGRHTPFPWVRNPFLWPLDYFCSLSRCGFITKCHVAWLNKLASSIASFNLLSLSIVMSMRRSQSQSQSPAVGRDKQFHISLILYQTHAFCSLVSLIFMINGWHVCINWADKLSHR